MPDAQTWNGKFVGTGNGGYSGAIGFADMRNALQHGYATAGSNTGHDGGDLKFGLGHPEKIKDWAYRAVHVMTETAKEVMRTYYERAATHAYFTRLLHWRPSGSNGGAALPHGLRRNPGLAIPATTVSG